MNKQEFVASIRAAGPEQSYLRYTKAGHEFVQEQFFLGGARAIVRVSPDCVYAVPWLRLEEWEECLDACYRVYEELCPVWVPARDFGQNRVSKNRHFE